MNITIHINDIYVGLLMYMYIGCVEQVETERATLEIIRVANELMLEFYPDKKSPSI